MQKFLFDINRDPAVQQRARTDLTRLLDRYDLTAEERGAIAAGDIGLIYVLGANGQLLDALRRVSRHAVGRLHRRDARRRRASRAGARRPVRT